MLVFLYDSMFTDDSHSQVLCTFGICGTVIQRVRVPAVTQLAIFLGKHIFTRVFSDNLAVLKSGARRTVFAVNKNTSDLPQPLAAADVGESCPVAGSVDVTAAGTAAGDVAAVTAACTASCGNAAGGSVPVAGTVVGESDPAAVTAAVTAVGTGTCGNAVGGVVPDGTAGGSVHATGIAPTCGSVVGGSVPAAAAGATDDLIVESAAVGAAADHESSVQIQIQLVECGHSRRRLPHRNTLPINGTADNM